MKKFTQWLKCLCGLYNAFFFVESCEILGQLVRLYCKYTTHTAPYLPINANGTLSETGKYKCYICGIHYYFILSFDAILNLSIRVQWWQCQYSNLTGMKRHQAVSHSYTLTCTPVHTFRHSMNTHSTEVPLLINTHNQRHTHTSLSPLFLPQSCTGKSLIFIEKMVLLLFICLKIIVLYR